MTNEKWHRIAANGLILLPLLLMAFKVSQQSYDMEQFLPITQYEVQYQLEFTHLAGAAHVKAYVPQSNFHQKIDDLSILSNGFDFEIKDLETGSQAIWSASTPQSDVRLQYGFIYIGTPQKYNIPNRFPRHQPISSSIMPFLKASKYIQSEDASIIQLASNLKGEKKDMKSVLEAIFQYVYELPYIETTELTDALMTLQNQEASCNGKARLFVALCRALDIPARIAGGIILENNTKKTSHGWTEVFVAQTWIPFDPSNGHFATLPARYMELYKGDEFLMKHANIENFDYRFAIKKQHIIKNTRNYSAFSLASLFNSKILPKHLLSVLLLLPICALVVALFKNVIGLKTFGTFLPALIAISLEGSGLLFGLIAFLIVIGVVSLLNYPLEKMGLLHTPKLVIMLVIVVMSLLVISTVVLKTAWFTAAQSLYFPIVILAITAERFAQKTIEDGWATALNILGQTLVVTLCCYAVFTSYFLVGVFICFPELFLVIIGLLLLLGNWIGVRLMEYRRFRWILNH